MKYSQKNFKCCIIFSHSMFVSLFIWGIFSEIWPKILFLWYWWNCIDTFILECTLKILRYDYDHSLDLYKIAVIYVTFMKYIRKRDTIESNCPCTNSNNLEGNVKRDHSYKKQTNNTYLSISWSCADIDILRYRCLFFKRKSLC